MDAKKLEKLREISKDLTLLYVEDDQSIREQMHKFLQKLFKEVSVAGNGEEGLELYSQKGFDLVVSDIAMPTMNGLEMSREIHKIKSDQTIVIVSAYSDSSYLFEAIELGIDNYMVKPIDFDKMVEVLYKASNKLHLKKENEQYKNHLEELVQEQLEKIEYDYITDELTGLSNRIKLTMDLNKNNKSSVALFLLNVDNFSSLNDYFGMEIGDKLLQTISKILEENYRDTFQIYRIGADEFVLADYKEISIDPETFVRQINKEIFAKIIEVENLRTFIQFSIGFSKGVGNEVLKEAEVALKRARLIGKARIGKYEVRNHFEHEQNEILQWIHQIQLGIEENRFVPFFQPIVNNESGEIEKYECLARLHLNGEIIYPGKFIKAAQKGGYITDITRIMIQKSFERFKNISYDFSINITSNDLQDGSFFEFLEEQSSIYKIDTHRVTFEILEGISMQSDIQISRNIQRFKELGYKIAIDDFGMEGSNFSRLLDISVDFIKIDGNFIRNIVSDENSMKITKSIVDFAKNIGAKTIAEFVENEAIQKIVKDLGIDYSQGYYFSEAKENC